MLLLNYGSTARGPCSFCVLKQQAEWLTLSANPHAHVPVCPMSWTPGGRIRKGLCPNSSDFWQLGLLGGRRVALEMADVLSRCWEGGQEVGEPQGWATSPIYKEKVLAQGALGQRFPWGKVLGKKAMFPGLWGREEVDEEMFKCLSVEDYLI